MQEESEVVREWEAQALGDALLRVLHARFAKESSCGNLPLDLHMLAVVAEDRDQLARLVVAAAASPSFDAFRETACPALSPEQLNKLRAKYRESGPQGHVPNLRAGEYFRAPAVFAQVVPVLEARFKSAVPLAVKLAIETETAPTAEDIDAANRWLLAAVFAKSLTAFCQSELPELPLTEHRRAQVSRCEPEPREDDGKRAGMVEARREDLLRLLRSRVRLLPMAWIAAVMRQADLETLTRWFDAALRAGQWDDFEALLKQ